MSGFNVYALDSPKAIRTYKDRVEKRRAEFVQIIATPNAVKDWDEYKRLVGVLEGIDEALRVCDDLEKEAEDRR